VVLIENGIGLGIDIETGGEGIYDEPDSDFDPDFDLEWAHPARGFMSRKTNDISPAVGKGPPMTVVGVSLLRWLALFALLWWVLTEGRTGAWGLGLVFVVLGLGSAVAVRIGPNGWRAPVRLSWIGLLRLAPYFVWQSLSGGVDVALRALMPGLRLAPDLIDYRLRLPPGPAPVLLASLVSLTPGTLAFVNDDSLRVHVLDIGDFDQARLARMEQLVAGAFGIEVADP